MPAGGKEYSLLPKKMKEVGRELTTQEWKAEKKRKKAVMTAQQALPYKVKLRRSKQRAYEFIKELDKRSLNAHVSVGGLDSIMLLLWLRREGIDIPAISVSALEDKSMQKIHKALGVIGIPPGKSKVEILNEVGFPVISKKIAGRKETYQRGIENRWYDKSYGLEDMPESIIPETYGTIERREDGTLHTTGAQRTGCSMCGFGIHLEKRPHRFDRLRQRNPKEWEFWMYACCTDSQTGEKYGWGRVLDYIGVPWEDEWKPEPIQMELEFL